MLTYKILLDVDKFIQTHYDPSIPADAEIGDASYAAQKHPSWDPTSNSFDGFLSNDAETVSADPDFAPSDPDFAPAGPDFAPADPKSAAKFSVSAPVSVTVSAPVSAPTDPARAEILPVQGSGKAGSANGEALKNESLEGEPPLYGSSDDTPSLFRSPEGESLEYESAEYGLTDGAHPLYGPTDIASQEYGSPEGEELEDEYYLEPAAVHGSLFTRRRSLFGKLLSLLDGTRRIEEERTARYKNIPDEDSSDEFVSTGNFAHASISQQRFFGVLGSDQNTYDAFGSDQNTYDAFGSDQNTSDAFGTTQYSFAASVQNQNTRCGPVLSEDTSDTAAQTEETSHEQASDTEALLLESVKAARAEEILHKQTVEAELLSLESAKAARAEESSRKQAAHSVVLSNKTVRTGRANELSRKQAVREDELSRKQVSRKQPAHPEEISHKTVRTGRAGIDPDLERRFQNADEGFVDILLRKIDASGMTDSQCYSKAQMNRSHFNRIKNDPEYHVMKRSVIALILALGLDRFQADELLTAAGYALSNGSKADIIVQYCIEHGIYNLTEVNELLFAYDQPLLGAGIRN